MDIYNVRKEMKENKKTVFDMPLRVAYYARVSTDADEQLHSLSAQKRHFEEFISKNTNWVFVKGYIDEGISGTTTKKRDAFAEMVKDAYLKKYDLLLTKEISRFARNTVDSLNITQELLRYGICVFFENDNLNTIDPDSELRLTIMASIAQEESRKISERIKFGFGESIKNGVVLGNNNIWGYRKENGKLVIVPEQAEMVRTVFDLYANKNLGVRRVAEEINKMGYRNSNGNPFGFSTIRGIIKNPKYKGFYCGKKTHKLDFRHNERKNLPSGDWVMYEDKANVPQIVSEELWERANRAYKERSESVLSDNKTSYHNKYAYSGKIVCCEHNTCYQHRTNKRKNGKTELWACSEYIKGNGCKSPLIYNSELDEIMRLVYNELVSEKDSVINELIEIYKTTGTHNNFTKERQNIEDEIEGIYLKKDKLLDLSLDGKLTNEEFAERNNRFNLQLEALKEKLLQLDECEKKSRSIKDSIENLRGAILAELDFKDGMNRGIVDSFIEKIVVTDTENCDEIKLEIYLKLIPDSISSNIIRSKNNPSVCSIQHI